MAWGYEKCFTIEHDNTLKRRIDCKDCIYYDSSDKSCMNIIHGETASILSWIIV